MAVTGSSNPAHRLTQDAQLLQELTQQHSVCQLCQTAASQLDAPCEHRLGSAK